MPEAAIATFGCKVNQYESAFLAEVLARHGWRLVPLSASPELVVVNTCTVTGAADRQARQFIRRLARTRPSSTVLVTGCYAQRAPEELAPLPGVRWVLGNREKTRLIKIIQEDCQHAAAIIRVGSIAAAQTLESMPITSFYGHTRAFVKIQDGCQNYCSYCILPYVRGPCRSLPLTQIIDQLEQLSSRGYQEIVLTGINLGKYGHDLPNHENLSELVQTLAQAGLPGRYRLSSIEPQEITPALLRQLAAWPQFCPHFHLPLQSGSASVLQAMRRPYSPEDFRELVNQINRYFPQAALGVDVLVGFPGETARDLAQTQELIEALPISYLHVFPFSPRPGTAAAQMPQRLSTTAVKRRAQSLRALGQEKKAVFYQRQVGQELEILVEGPCSGKPGWVKGLSANYLRLVLEGGSEWTNRLVRARLVGIVGEQGVALPV
ncbi:MAG: tRNA (N(6)-L-threonylcarbamoyladenosine(37)-C(2))-methylthiotransferase MtaB [Deltaproteobacteria bacterium]|nr:tRNA (N(6)-L-threonylcarbamoyladenosine(37)-C(2))-methylthiotransferase MtaB [Deltaproteobacteria bacterium]MBW1951671.1 tRNA (N(6)-L-threonylcarbamoyladenosine(37)-C(2))-methylthiotransferase MtaB [Deltaproteobacteria bacterium]MBW1985770.1 tRNA (N(6)-L-threonylcarbamoyladenosine(37)-C(2))-methylthiotransferase MtaB [Deltaproteobacteria bacterium]MBW2134685.1 tRNA (N(6)-L-threonylcarbamoyladenosine(37)-C(2))-methylthiotransferase MtaB [Deltaproteobacteria bacterium]